MRVYISGAITGTDDYMERFAREQKQLEDIGHTVINPALVCSNLPADTTYDEYMKMSLCMLSMSDAIYLMPGWKLSKGSRKEYAFAKRKHKKVLYGGFEW